MKIPLRSTLVVTLATFIALGLSNCGSTGSVSSAGSGGSGGSGGNTTTPPTAFAYLVDTSSGTSSDLAANRAAAHTRAHSQLGAHKASPRSAASGNVTYDIRSGSMDIHIYDTAKSTDTNVTSPNATCAAAGTCPGPQSFENVQLSNDGKTLLFTADDNEGGVQIWLANTQTLALTPLTANTNLDGIQYHVDAALSADGTTVVYDDAFGSLYTIPTTTTAGTAPVSTEVLLTSTSGVHAEDPVFAGSSNTTIVFDGWTTEGPHLIYSVAVGATTPTQLTIEVPATNGKSLDYQPTVSFDGTTVAFTRQVCADTCVVSVAVNPIGTPETATTPATVLTSDGEVGQSFFLGNNILYVDWSSTTGIASIYEIGDTPSTAAATQLTNTSTTTSPQDTIFNNWF